MFHKTQNIVSPQLLELLGLDKVMLSGPLWIEFEKTTDDTFNLAVYTAGSALQCHPIDMKTGQHYGVLRLSAIKPDKLNQDFFYSLLKRHVEPLWNPNSASKSIDIYSGPISSLEANQLPNFPDDPKIADGKPSTNWLLALSILLKTSIPTLDPIFEMRWTAILDLCKSHLTSENTLELDIATCQALEAALADIEDDIKAMKKIPENKQKTSKIKATIKEIRHALTLAYEKQGKQTVNIAGFDLLIDKDISGKIKSFIKKQDFRTRNCRNIEERSDGYLGKMSARCSIIF